MKMTYISTYQTTPLERTHSVVIKENLLSSLISFSMEFEESSLTLFYPHGELVYEGELALKVYDMLREEGGEEGRESQERIDATYLAVYVAEAMKLNGYTCDGYIIENALRKANDGKSFKVVGLDIPLDNDIKLPERQIERAEYES